MKNVLFIDDVSIKNPIRGTPLRIRNFLVQIRREHNLFICTKDVPDDFKDSFIPYPNLSVLNRLVFFKNIIKVKKIDVVLTTCETIIKLPIALKFLTGVKIAIDIHGIEGSEGAGLEEKDFVGGTVEVLKKNILNLMAKFYLSFYDAVFVISQKLKNWYSGANSNINVIYGGVNMNEFLPLAPKLPSEILTVGYMGNSRPYQGIQFLLEALKNIKAKGTFKFRLNLIISGNRDELIFKLKQCKLYDDTDLIFDVRHSDVASTINKSDVLVIPRPSIKVTEYAYPSKLTEYLATGIPLIITNVGPVDEILQDGISSIIADKEDIAGGLERALVRFYNMNENQRTAIGRAGIDLVKSELTWDILGRKINKILEDI